MWIESSKDNLVNQLPYVFIDRKRVIKSYISAVNAHIYRLLML